MLIGQMMQAESMLAWSPRLVMALCDLCDHFLDPVPLYDLQEVI